MSWATCLGRISTSVTNVSLRSSRVSGRPVTPGGRSARGHLSAGVRKHLVNDLPSSVDARQREVVHKRHGSPVAIFGDLGRRHITSLVNRNNSCRVVAGIRWWILEHLADGPVVPCAAGFAKHPG